MSSTKNITRVHSKSIFPAKEKVGYQNSEQKPGGSPCNQALIIEGFNLEAKTWQ